MRKPSIHVVPSDGSWKVKQEGNPRPISTHPTQASAIQAGRQAAKFSKTELVTHRPNGRIRDSDSFGNDPCPPRDEKH